MRRVESIREVRAEVDNARLAGKSVGFVPTMGAFHDGHVSLMRRARADCDFVVVSIFVNPMQFDRRSDFQSYPRDEAADEERASAERVDLLFVPSAEEMYPGGFRTRVEVEELSGVLCGSVRPGHFGGVATVVTKLLEIVRPDRAYFGEKDYQQLAIVGRLARDLNLPVEIVGAPTVRESDGLAMSSRNQLLSATEREAAGVLWRALSSARQQVEKGETDVDRLGATMRRMIGEEPLVRLEYLSIVDPKTLLDVRRVHGDVLIAVAAYVGTTRLIDNVTASSPI
ncbi:MAG: pantoate--beta-alanine ligase [Actinobacteria bacterium]|nr:MAG: pantoate--beta-alanine ligase [Actinomycetota bacterium]